MHDVHSTNSSTNKHKERKTMDIKKVTVSHLNPVKPEAKFFEVSPEWMKACGHEGEENIMEIIKVEHLTNMPSVVQGLKDWYTLKAPWGREWLVAGGRGKPVK
jgi:hypothetical protein